MKCWTDLGSEKVLNMIEEFFLKKGLRKLNHQENKFKISSLTQNNPLIPSLFSIKLNNKKNIMCSIKKDLKALFKPTNK